MIGALLYLQCSSMLNRTLRRLKRLRQPKYLLFAVVGAVYFYAYFFRHFIGRRAAAAIPFSDAPESQAFVELIGALLLFVVMFLAWFIPHQRAALLFTEAEIAFLFPAPITRRGLIHYKLLRSQLSILFTTLFLALVTRRFASHFWIRVGGWWLILSTLNLHFMGSSFARTLLLDRGVSNWKRRTAAAILAASLIGLVIWWAHQTVPPAASTIENVQQLKDYGQRVLFSGPALYILYPL